MSGNWWIDVSGRNTLRGVPGDDTNPPILGNDIILSLLNRYPDARLGFKALLPTMLPAEQERLNSLLATNPYAFKSPQVDPQTESDRIQRAWNTRSIRNVGPRGGGL